jgi:D-alanyl-D-alanine carboxypeptidase
MKKKSVWIGIVGFLMVGLGGFFSYREYLLASQEGTLRTYNSLTDNREQINRTSSTDITHYGTIADERGENSFFDFFSDHSFQKFLDDTHTLTPSYRPDDVVEIHSDFTANAASRYQLRQEAAIQFADMARAFADTFNFEAKLSLTSAWRSPVYQKQLSATCSTQRCALPGTSEHEAGLAVDVGVNGGNILSAGGKYYQWLYDNAHRYGFHNTYQKGIAIDGKIVEPWHWRYVGVALATYLHES